MKEPNWHRFIDTLYSWEVVANEFSSFESSVRHTREKTYGRNVSGFQVLERIWNMGFYDLTFARKLVKNNNKNSFTKYRIRYQKLL